VGDQEHVADAVAHSRRSFVKKLLAAGFAIPVVSSFALDSVAAAGPTQGKNCEDQFAGNLTKTQGRDCEDQFFGNQTLNVFNFPHGHERFLFNHNQLWTGDS
jgi:hypothetical protein